MTPDIIDLHGSNQVSGWNRVRGSDMQQGTQRQVDISDTGAAGNRTSNAASMSTDGRYVALQSYATNFAPNDRNHAADIFVRGPLR